MAFGPGKYDEQCRRARLEAKAAGVLLIVLEGKHGSGFSAQLSPSATLAIPGLLRDVADEIERDAVKLAAGPGKG